jgi:hypothetical protein
MKEMVIQVAAKLTKSLTETMEKCFDLGVIDERKRIIEKINKSPLKDSPGLQKLLAELKKELAELGK